MKVKLALLLFISVTLASCGGGSTSNPQNDTTDDNATNTGIGITATGVGGTNSNVTNRNDAGGALSCGGEIDSENPFPCCNNKADAWASDSIVGNCTWYAWRAAKNYMGIQLPMRGNAGNWLAEANTYISSRP